MRILISAIAALLAITGIVIAQDTWRTLPDNRSVNGIVTMCVNDEGYAVPVTVTANPCPIGGGTQSTNIAQVGGATVATGSGTAAGTIRVELPTNGTGVVGLNAGSNIIGNVRIDQTTPGTTNAVVAASTAGVAQAFGATNSDTQSTSSTANHSLILARQQYYDGTQFVRARGDTVGAYVQLKASTSGGATAFKRVSTADTNAAVIKGSAGQLCLASASNVNAAVRYLKLYNKATAPTVGTDVPVFTIAIPGATTGGLSPTFQPAVCVEFATGISMALTTEATDAGSTGVAASEIVVNVGYK